ncbi:hypothetical protein Q9S78_02105 [Microbacterium sp. KSW-18]|uniref:Uncharacterized protein n=1 Tax=Microbacterium aquilitoris TaxID=3067307 RepID=A0ABU3GFH9_9MICO|nr:hypothetical protein [Microbacterium sp. KSW-18]MDT3329452.1 hypothetical protein [Microbacterium sp. KSW-18]
MTRKTRAIGSALIVGGIILCGAACAPTQAEDLLAFGSEPATICVPVTSGAQIVVADQVRLLHSTTPVTLESAHLVEGEGLEIADAFIVRNKDGMGVGTMLLDAPDPLWADRVPLEGATLTGNHVWSVALVLKREGSAAGQADAMSVTYRTQSGAELEAAGAMEIQLRERCG